jgi:16S rRNA (guanine527-N7)-methyltransferase
MIANNIAGNRDNPIKSIASFALTQSAQDKLTDYVSLLKKWNGVYNLTAIRDEGEMLTLHIADCLAIVPHFPDRGTVLDVGTGGGLPGIVLAIVKPELRITLCDAVQKKCAFLLQVKGALNLSNVEVRHARVEDLRGEFDIITSRAFADLSLMITLTRHLLAPAGKWLAMKAATASEEIAALPADIAAQIIPLQVPGLDATRCLVKLQQKLI